MTTWRLLTSSWRWHPSVILGCLGLLVGYFALPRSRSRGAAVRFVLGVLVIGLALVSPLDALGDTYLFSAHMAQHLLLILVAPPLLLLGIPASSFRGALRFPPARRLEAFLRRPVVAWTAGVGVLWAWHLPALYDAALASELVHVGEHLSFLVTATVLWWPVLGPATEYRYPPLTAVVYLFAAAGANILLGVLLTLAPVGLYPAYLSPADELGALSLIREGWGLTPAADQQLGGLLMWVPAGFVFLWAILLSLGRWYREEERVS
jgi:putative membrane protein